MKEEVGYCPPLSDNWLTFMVYLYIALSTTLIMDCYWKPSTSLVLPLLWTVTGCGKIKRVESERERETERERERDEVPVEECLGCFRETV